MRLRFLLSVALVVNQCIPLAAAAQPQQPSNHAPVAVDSDPPIHGGQVGEPLIFQVSATDPDGDRLTLSPSKTTPLPEGVHFTTVSAVPGEVTGEVSWTPSATQAGTHELRFLASDGTAKPTEIPATVLVSAPPIPEEPSAPFELQSFPLEPPTVSQSSQPIIVYAQRKTKAKPGPTQSTAAPLTTGFFKTDAPDPSTQITPSPSTVVRPQVKATSSGLAVSSNPSSSIQVPPATTTGSVPQQQAVSAAPISPNQPGVGAGASGSTSQEPPSAITKATQPPPDTRGPQGSSSSEPPSPSPTSPQPDEPPRRPAARTAYVNFDVLVVIYTNTFRGGVSDEEVRLIKDDLERVRQFYWRNSRCTVNLSLTFLDIAEFKPQAATDAAGLLPAVVARDLRTRGVVPDQYDAVVGISNVNGNLGLETVLGLGSTMYSTTGTRGGRGRRGVEGDAIHELLHGIENMVNRSRFDFLDVHANFFGTYNRGDDTMAYILRTWPRFHWPQLRAPWGTRIETTDADQDGVPDDDPRVPLDEQRMRTRPDRVDTDGDLLSDLGELAAGQDGMANPLDRDSDRDGLLDGGDANPTYAVNNWIPRFSPIRDGFIEDGWPLFFNDATSPKGQGLATHLSWDASGLHVAVRLATPRPFTLLIDANHDGFLTVPGIDLFPDNYVISIDPSARQIVSAYIRLADTDPDPRLTRQGLVRPEDILAAFNESGTVVELTIPSNAATELRPFPGKELGVSLVYDRDEYQYSESMFDQTHLIDVTLVETVPSDRLTPVLPRLLAPTDGAVVSARVVSARDVRFDWTDVTDLGGSGLRGYHFQLDNQLTFESPLVDTVLNASETSVTLPEAEGYYYWRVRALDRIGNATPYTATRTVLLAEDWATFESVTIPSLVTVGETSQGRAVVRNAGTSTWTRDGYAFIRQLGPTGSSNQSISRSQIPHDHLVAPGDTIEFEFPIGIRTNPGSYLVELKMIRGSGVFELTRAFGLTHVATINAQASLAPTITGLSVSPASVPQGGTYTASFEGTNLTATTSFDIRLRRPDGTVQVLDNWQQGPSGSQTVAPTAAVGTWAITAARVHTDPPDPTRPILDLNATPVTLTVRPASSGYSVTASATRVRAGEALTVRWTAPPGRPPFQDLIGLYELEAGRYVWWQYTQGETAGSFSLPAPETPGKEYEFRYVPDRGSEVVARSARVSVVVPPVPQGRDDAAFLAWGEIPARVQTGQRFTVTTLTMRNTGTTTWASDPATSTSYVLVASQPVWTTDTGTNKAPLPSAPVSPPDGTLVLTFDVTAPTTPGRYEFKWQMGREVLGVVTRFGQSTTPGVEIEVFSPTPSPTKPDLVVSAIDIRPAAPQVGDVLTITSTIANRGTAAAPATQATYEIHELVEGGSRTVVPPTAYAVDPLVVGSPPFTSPPGLFPAGRAATYTVRVCADSANQVDEGSEDGPTKNCFSRTVTVAPPLSPPLPPDLAAILELPSTPATVGRAVTLPGRIRNVGQATTPASQAIYEIRTAPGLGDPIGRVVGNTVIAVPPLAAALEHPVPWDFTPQAVGDYLVRLCTSGRQHVPDDATAENNCATQRLTVQRAPMPNLSVRTITLSPPSPSAGTQVNLTATICNTEAVAAAASLARYYFEGPGLQRNTGTNQDRFYEVGRLEVVGSPSACETSAPGSFTPGTAGRYRVTVCANTGTDTRPPLAETSTFDNCQTSEVDVAPSLTLTDVTPRTLTAGQTITLTATGTGFQQGDWLIMTSNGPARAEVGNPASIGPGSNQLQASLTIPRTAPPGAYTLTVTRNPGSAAPVVSNGLLVTVLPLTATLSGQIRRTDGMPIAGASVRLDGAPLGGTYRQSPPTDGTGTYTFPNLPEGSYTITPTVGGYTLTPPTAVVTLAGADGRADFTARLLAPNLSVRTITLSPTAPTAGTQVSLTATICNTEPVAAAASLARYYFEGPGLQRNTGTNQDRFYEVGPLGTVDSPTACETSAPGAFTPSTAGRYSVTVFANTGTDTRPPLAETTNLDNRQTTEVDVAPGITLTDVAPRTLTAGQTIPLTATGTGFQQGDWLIMKYNGPERAEVGNVASVGPGSNQLQASLVIPSNAPPGAYTLTVTRNPGSLAPVVSNGLPLTVLPLTATLSGQIRRTDGMPIAGASVRLDGAPLGGTYRQSPPTDGTGTYTFPNLPAGTYTITPTVSGYTLDATSRTHELSPTTTRVPDFLATPIPPTPTLTGLTVSPPSVAQGGTYTTTFEGENLTATPAFDIRLRRPDGTVQVLDNWQQGLIGPHVVPADAALGLWQITAARAQGGPVLDLTAPPLQPVSLTVTAPAPRLDSVSPGRITAGQPQQTLTLTGTGFPCPASIHYTNGTQTRVLPATSCSSNAVTLTDTPPANTPPGPYTVRIQSPDGSQVSNPLPLSVDPPPTYTLSGRIRRTDGMPIAGASVRLDGAPLGGTSRETTTDLTGTYTFPNLPDGTYNVTPTMGGYTLNPSMQVVILMVGQGPLVTVPPFTATLIPPAQPNLTVNTLWVTSGPPTANQPITFQATILNSGTAAAGASWTQYAFSGPSGERISGGYAPALAASGAFSASFTFTPTVPGPHAVNACVDVNNVVAETDDADNCRTVFPVTVSPPPAPQPTCRLTFNGAAQTSGPAGTRVDIEWSTQYDADGLIPYSCTGIPPGQFGPSGRITRYPTQDTYCWITPQNASGTTSCSAAFFVTP